MNKGDIKYAYLAGFLDADGSVYVKLTKNKTYRFRYQISSYIAFYQSEKSTDFFRELKRLHGIGYIRRRKDGIVEWIIGDKESQLLLIERLIPFCKLKKKQLLLMRKIIRQKSKVKTAEDFLKVCRLVDEYRNLNYSKKRTQNAQEVFEILRKEKIITPVETKR